MLFRFLTAISLLVIALPGASYGASFTRRASLSVLDVPVAETIGHASASFGLEFFLERDQLGWTALPLPFSVVAGVGDRLDFGFSAQYGGLPGDAVTPGTPVLQWTLAAKFLVLPRAGWVPSLAVEAQLDRPTTNPRVALRAVASTGPLGPLRLTAFAGAELGLAPVAVGPHAGLAVLASHPSGLEGFAEGLYSSRGWLAGAGARFTLTEHLGFTASATWIPQEASVRMSVGLAVFLEPPPPVPTPPEEVVDGQPRPQPVGPRRFFDDRPRMRLRIHLPREGDEPAGRHHQYAPERGATEDAAPPAPAPPATSQPKSPLEPVKAQEVPPTPDIPSGEDPDP